MPHGPCSYSTVYCIPTHLPSSDIMIMNIIIVMLLQSTHTSCYLQALSITINMKNAGYKMLSTISSVRSSGRLGAFCALVLVLAAPTKRPPL